MAKVFIQVVTFCEFFDAQWWLIELLVFLDCGLTAWKFTPSFLHFTPSFRGKFPAFGISVMHWFQPQKADHVFCGIQDTCFILIIWNSKQDFSSLIRTNLCRKHPALFYIIMNSKMVKFKNCSSIRWRLKSDLERSVAIFIKYMRVPNLTPCFRNSFIRLQPWNSGIKFLNWLFKRHFQNIL